MCIVMQNLNDENHIELSNRLMMIHNKSTDRFMMIKQNKSLMAYGLNP